MSQGLPQSSFAAGELTPALAARIDLDRYHIGLRTAQNVFVMREGGVSNRPGTTYIASTMDITKPARLIPFVFNSDQTYVLEFGDQYMRVYRNGGLVTPAGAPTYAGGTTYQQNDIVRVGTTPVYYLSYTAVPNLNHPPASNPAWWRVITVVEMITPYALADLWELQYTQSADVVTIVHPNYAPRELRRSDHWDWSLTAIGFTPDIAAPTNLTVTYGGAGSLPVSHTVTAVDPDTGQESAAATAVTDTYNFDTTWANRIELSWDAVTAPSGSSVARYNVYRQQGGSVYGFIGQALGTTFIDRADNAAYEISPLEAYDPWPSSDWPSCVTYHQQRLCFANTPKRTQAVLCSQTGNYHDFRQSSPPQSDDALIFTMATNQANGVRWLASLRVLVAGTAGAEYAIGKPGEALTPATISAQPQSFNGSGALQPIIIGNTALYVQAMGSAVRGIGYDFQQDAYTGPDLSVMSEHLFRGYTITDWAYCRVPYSTVWAVRDDGTLLCLTLMREHDVVAWSHHVTDGSFKSVCSVPEGDEDALYVCVERTLNGTTTHTVERFATRLVGDVEDCHFVDCGLSYDGRNTGSTTLTIGAGSTYAVDDLVTITASVATFDASWEQDVVEVTIAGTVYAGRVEVYLTDTTLRCRLLTAVPVAARGSASAVWTRKTLAFAGLSHLNGLPCSVLADGVVQPAVTPVAGTATITYPAARVHIGLPYTALIETLGVALPNSDLRTRKKIIKRVTVDVVDSRGFQAGQDVDHLELPKWRDQEPYGSADDLKSGQIEVYPGTSWSILGRVVVQQSDPLPLTVIAVTPEVEAGG